MSSPRRINHQPPPPAPTYPSPPSLHPTYPCPALPPSTPPRRQQCRPPPPPNQAERRVLLREATTRVLERHGGLLAAAGAFLRSHQQLLHILNVLGKVSGRAGGLVRRCCTPAGRPGARSHTCSPGPGRRTCSTVRALQCMCREGVGQARHRA